MPNKLIRKSYTEQLRLRVLDLEDRYWKLNTGSQELMSRVEKLLSNIEIAERKFGEHPNIAHMLDEVRVAKIELSSYIMQSPELRALLKTFEATPKESADHTVKKIDEKHKRLG